MSDPRYDPIISGNFFLDLGGQTITTLSEVSGLEDETEVVELQQSTKNGKVVIVKTQGATPLKGGKLTLKYAVMKTDPVKAWYDDVVNSKQSSVRNNISIKLNDSLDALVLQFDFKNAWPSKYSLGSVSSKSNDTLMATVTIEHEGMDVKGYNS